MVAVCACLFFSSVSLIFFFLPAVNWRLRRILFSRSLYHSLSFVASTMVQSTPLFLSLLGLIQVFQAAALPTGGSCPAIAPEESSKHHSKHHKHHSKHRTSTATQTVTISDPTVVASSTEEVVSVTPSTTVPEATSDSSVKQEDTSAPPIVTLPATSSSSTTIAVSEKATSTSAVTSKVPLPTVQAGSKSYPFKEIVAFGDELSDNGNGSYAHGITGDPANVYSFGTWTDGPVAVSYLADLLGVPLTDYAFGGDKGGENGGATIDNDYAAAGAQWNGQPVPSVHQQIYDNYTKSSNGIEDAMQFIMVGQNDLSAKTDAFWEGDPKNSDFADTMASTLTEYAEYLIKQGAPYVFVSNIYPKHKAPVTVTYLCSDGGCVDTWGKIIEAANSAIKEKLAASDSASKIIYYDLYSYMMGLMDNKDASGLTQSLADFCDGDAAVAKWDECIAGSYVWEGAEKFYWMNYIQPTTHVHRLIAEDMKATIDTFLSA